MIVSLCDLYGLQVNSGESVLFEAISALKYDLQEIKKT